MTWSKRQEKLIKAVIRHERKCLKTIYEIGYSDEFWNSEFCPFCKIYKKLTCSGCPNVKINRILQLGNDYMIRSCDMNKKNTYDYNRADRTLLRIQWWKDTLKMTEGQFKVKYGK